MSFIVFLDMDGVLVDLPKKDPHLKLDQIPEYQDSSFWNDLPKLPWADDLMQACTPHAAIFILTRPCGPASIIGKTSWMGQHYPSLQNKLIFTKHKHLLAGENRILVDDNKTNCDLFTEWDGIALQVKDSITPIKVALAGLFRFVKMFE